MITAPLYPVNLVVNGRRCLIVGGGTIAARKAEGLLACGAVLTVVAPEIVPELAGNPAVHVQQRPFAPGDCAGYWFVVTATDDPAVNAAVARDAETHRVWVNAADDPDNCSATLPAVHRRGDLTVAVATGGTSPAVASWLRDRIAQELGPEIGDLLDVFAAVRRELQANGVSTEVPGWRQALDSDMLSLIRAGHLDRAKERLHECLSSSSV